MFCKSFHSIQWKWSFGHLMRQFPPILGLIGTRMRMVIRWIDADHIHFVFLVGLEL